jgi:tetratricopeptide (TPR) repeat protein
MTALKLQGLIALTKKDGPEAVKNFRILIEDEPQDPENWLLLARAYLVNNLTVPAKEAAQKALNLKPDYLKAQSLLYGIYFDDKDYDALIQLIEEHLRADEHNLANWGYLGDAYLLKGDESAARQAFQKMITLQPQNPAGYLKLALLSRKQQQLTRAAQYLETALKQNPNAHPALRLLIGIHQEGNQPAKALKAARAAVARVPKNAEMHQILGEVLLSQKQPEAAAAALAEALTLNPDDLQALGLLVRAYEEKSDKAAALKELEDKAANPQAPWFYALALAQLYEGRGEVNKAIPVYEGLLERNVAPSVVKNNLAYLLAEHRPTPENLARAQKMAAEILEDHPGDPRLLDTMGWIYCRQNDFIRGKTYLEKSVAKAPKHPLLQYHLGFCLARLGRRVRPGRPWNRPWPSRRTFPAETRLKTFWRALPSQPLKLVANSGKLYLGSDFSARRSQPGILGE